MYALLPWKWLISALTVVTALALYVDDVGRLFGIEVQDQHVIRYLPPVTLGFLAAFLGPTGYYAPWRIVWRWIPALNNLFPDLNGVWLGTTASNWPTIKNMLDSAKANSAIDELELHTTPEQRDALAVRLTASLFRLKIEASLSSTNGRSHSVAANSRRDQHSGRIHLTYVYEQTLDNPEITDEERHMGSADLVFDPDNLDFAEGNYWTRRNWKVGLNTAGRLYLQKVAPTKGKEKTLRQYAADEKARMTEVVR